MPQTIVDTKANEQYTKDYKEYALYVERHRTTPEHRDGLKPVQRRILYTARFISNALDNRKCADIVGSTMSIYSLNQDLYCLKILSKSLSVSVCFLISS